MKPIHRLLCELLIVVSFSTAFEASADPAVFSVDTVTRGEWRFPVVAGGGPGAAERINALMLINTFDLEFPSVPPADPKQSLAMLSEEESRSVASLEFRVLRNDGKIFSVLFDGEGCGAYCEGFQRPLAFEAATGRLLTDADLFSESGRQALMAEIVERNQKAVQEELGKVQAKAPSEFGSREEFDAAVQMYQSCLENWRSKEWQEWLGSLEIHPAEVLFVHGRCSNHVMQGMDDLGDLRTAFTVDALKPRLSDYGRSLLLGEASSAKPALPLGQWLKGSIGDKIRITCYLVKPYRDTGESEISGYYFYDKYRKPLKLMGKRNEGKLALTEYGANDKPQAGWTLESDGGGSLTGTWQSGDGKKSLPISLAY